MAVAPKRGPKARRDRWEAERRKQRASVRPDSGRAKSRDESGGGAWRERLARWEVAKSYAHDRANSRYLELSSEGAGGEVKAKGVVWGAGSHRGTGAPRGEDWGEIRAAIRVFRMLDCRKVFGIKDFWKLGLKSP